MATSIPKGEVKDIVEDQIEKRNEELAEAIEQVVRGERQHQVAELVRRVIHKLGDRGIDPGRTNVNVKEIARNEVIAALSDSDPDSSKTVEVPTAGRHNRDESTEITVSQESTAKTVTEEVPIEGGEDPDTIEVERTVPGANPRYNQSPAEVARSFREGMSVKEQIRLTEPPECKEYNPEDVPIAGKQEDDDE